MALSVLTQQEREVVWRCLRATVEGPFFPDWEFHALFGMERGEMASMLARWPELDDSEKDVQLAINNSLNTLLGYPHEDPEAFREWIGDSEEEVERIFDKWRQSCGLSP